MSDTGAGAPEETGGAQLTPAEKAAKIAELRKGMLSTRPQELGGAKPEGGRAPAAASPPAQRAAEPAERATPPEAPAAAPFTPAAPASPAAPAAPAGTAPDGGPRGDALQETTAVLTAGGAPAELAAAAVAEFGDGAAGRLRDDPWAVLGLPGVRPEHADRFARELLGPEAEPGDPRRGRALVLWLLEQAALRGHSALELTEVTAGLDRLRMPDPVAAVQAAVEDGRVLPSQEELTGAEAHAAGGEDDEPPTRTLLALERFAMAENILAEGLLQLMATFVPGDDVDPGEADPDDPGTDDAGTDEVDVTDDVDVTDVTDAEQKTGEAETGEEDATGPTATDATDATAAATQAPATPGPAAWAAAAEAAPSSSARALIQAVADNAVVLHTGGEAARAEAAALLAAARGLGLRAWAATWTDQGRTSFAALTGADADARADAGACVVTLAELLSGAAGPGRAPDGSLALDLLIVLDAPLLDVELAATVLESLADGTRLVLSGDPGQLWSAAPGRFFADLLAAKVCPAVASRTPDFGPIGELVSGVGIGELQPVEAPDKEVVILTAKDGGEAVHRAVQLLTDSIPRALGIPAEQVVLLTPGHGGPAGTRALNAAAKARLNPGPGRFGGFDPGDRVVDSPAPGITRPARVLDGDTTGLHLEYADGSRRTVPPAEAARLRHGWALTVHQALGRRWPGAVVVLPEDAAAALTRQWVYTAFGRGERHLSVVHAAGPALAQAVAERPAQPRTTRLRAILAENGAMAH